MQEIPSAGSLAVVSGDFVGFEPETLFHFWTMPEHLCTWWPTEATVDAKVGGEYRFEWPAMNWVLFGRYTALEPGVHLGFTWNWSHEPHKFERQVDVFFQPVDGGTRVAIYHGEFQDDPLEREDRRGIIEGWIHFGMILAGLRTGQSS